MVVTHRFVSPKPEQADPTIVGPNEWNAIHVISGGLIFSSDSNFAPQAPGNTLNVGANSITLNPFPGCGIVTGSSLYISDGANSEVVPISGVSGSTIIVTCARSHAGGWTIQSATGGIQEAINCLPAIGGEIIINQSTPLYINVTAAGKSFVQLVKLAGIVLTGSFTLLGQSSMGDARTETFSYTSTNNTSVTTGNVITGTSPTWTTGGATPTPYAALTANMNNFPLMQPWGVPPQFGGQAILGATNVPSNAQADGGSGVTGIAATSSTTTAAIGMSSYGATLVDGASAWGANFLVTNKSNVLATTGVHARGLIGVEIDVGNFGPVGADDVIGLQIISENSNVQPSVAYAIQIAPLGSGLVGSPQWTTGIQFYTGSCQIAMDIFPQNAGNNQGSPPIRIWSQDAAGEARQSQIFTDANGVLHIVGGNGVPFRGIQFESGNNATLMDLEPTFTFLNPLPVFANNAGAVAGGMTAGQLYKTATGQVMQVF